MSGVLGAIGSHAAQHVALALAKGQGQKHIWAEVLHAWVQQLKQKPAVKVDAQVREFLSLS